MAPRVAPRDSSSDKKVKGKVNSKGRLAPTTKNVADDLDASSDDQVTWINCDSCKEWTLLDGSAPLSPPGQVSPLFECRTCRLEALCNRLSEENGALKMENAALHTTHGSFRDELANLHSELKHRLCKLEALVPGNAGECTTCAVIANELVEVKKNVQKIDTDIKAVQEVVVNIVPGERSCSEANSGEASSTPSHELLFAEVVKKSRMGNAERNKLLTAATCSTAIATELAERSRREKNLLFFNVPENDGDLNEKRAADVQTLSSVMQALGTNIQRYDRVFRLGRQIQDGKTRPLLVTFTCKGDRDSVWENTRKCRDIVLSPLTRQVGISPDRTPAERQAHNDHRCEHKRRLASKNCPPNPEAPVT